MKNIIPIMFIIFSTVSFGQYFGPEVEQSIIKENNIIKCLEYNIDDSTLFFKEYENGYYWVYDYDGLVIERNSYYYLDSNMEFTIHFIYDNEGRNIFWLWYDEHVLGKISRIRIEEFDSLGNNFGYRDFNGNEKYPEAFKTKNYYKTDHPDPIGTVDTVISKSKKEFYYFKSDNLTDTLQYKIEYHSDNQIDSSITQNKQSNHFHLQIQTYDYYESNNIKQYESISYNKNGNIESNNIIFFSENGLPKERWYIYYFDGEKREIHTAFCYEYNKNK